ncbi:conserved hypothetical protein [Rhodococcus sp. RD6.2]|uniref:hypothetical protein n=1 Tax=Rhodococcus sp. RD6.2 TaxID=260936 RepID=UPI00063B9797|nr:hypothetical protein [Rhodococcus sp. RD6.2]CRK49933.1 conserved hypothetical protein [Rhodococcus sp. RD6.2]
MNDALLAGESSGLDYLTRLGGLAGMNDDMARVVARYRAALSLDPDALHGDADVLRSTAAVMRAHLLAQEQAVERLRVAWSGDAADTALAALGLHLDLARADCVAVLAAARTLDEAGDLIRESSLARTEFVSRAFGQRVDEPGAGWPRPVLAAHVEACLTALTEFVAAVEDVVDGARCAVESAIDAICGQAEVPPAEAARPTVDAPLAPPAPVHRIDPSAPSAPSAPPVPPVADVFGGGSSAFGPGSGSSPQRDRRGAPGAVANDVAGTTAATGTDSGAELAGAGPL